MLGHAAFARLIPEGKIAPVNCVAVIMTIPASLAPLSLLFGMAAFIGEPGYAAPGGY